MEYKIIKVYGCPETDNLETELENEAIKNDKTKW